MNRSATRYEELNDLWNKAKQGSDDDLIKLVSCFEPLIRKESRIRGVVNEELVQDIRTNLVVKLKRYIAATRQ